MTPFSTSTAAQPPGTRSHLPSANITLTMSSWNREGANSGRSPTSRDRSAARAARFADRTAANVATARTSVPAAVASEATDAQSEEFTDCRLMHSQRRPSDGGGHPLVAGPNRPNGVEGEEGPYDGCPGAFRLTHSGA